MGVYNRLIKPFAPLWVALALPLLSTLVLSLIGLVWLQQQQTQVDQERHKTALILQLDTLTNQLAQEQLAVMSNNDPLWQKLRQQNKATLQQVLALGDEAETSRLTLLKSSLNQLYWAQQQTGELNHLNPQDITLPDLTLYNAVTEQLGKVNRQIAGNNANAQFLVHLRQLRQTMGLLKLSAKSILTHQPADNGLEILQKTYWLTQLTPINLTDQQQRLYAELIDANWQPLYPQLNHTLIERDVMDRQIPAEIQQLDTLTAGLDALLSDTRDTLTRQQEENPYQPITTGLFILAGLLPLTAMLIMAITLDQQAKRLKHSLNWVQTLTCGNLTATPHPALMGPDVLGQMAQSLDELRHHWRRTLLQIHAQCAALQNAALAQPPMAASPEIISDYAFTAYEPDVTPLYSTALPLRPIMDIPVMSDDFSVAHYLGLQQHLSGLNQASQALSQGITDWQGDAETLNQQIDTLADPLQRRLNQMSTLLNQVQGLDTWVETLNRYAHQCQQWVNKTREQAQHLDNNPQDLDALRDNVAETHQALTALLDTVQHLTPPVVTRLASQTTSKRPVNPTDTIQQLLTGFQF